MSHELLQKNLRYLLKHNNYTLYNFEKTFSIGTNNVLNILSGKSKKPSAELIQTIADALHVSTKTLFTTDIEALPYFTHTSFVLLTNITKTIGEEVESLKLNLCYVDIINIIEEVYAYSTSTESHSTTVDKKFVHWLLKQKYSINT